MKSMSTAMNIVQIKNSRQMNLATFFIILKRSKIHDKLAQIFIKIEINCLTQTQNNSSERPKNRGRPNYAGLDLRPATPISVIKFTSIDFLDEKVNGELKLSGDHKNSLSLSPIRNTLAQNKDKYLNGGIKHSCNIQKYRANHFDSTQDSLNIDTYMRDNSTLAIQEVDEEDLDYGIANPKSVKPRDLPHLEHSPKIGDSNNQVTMFRFPNFIVKKTDSHILIEDNEQYNKVPLASHRDKKW